MATHFDDEKRTEEAGVGLWGRELGVRSVHEILHVCVGELLGKHEGQRLVLDPAQIPPPHDRQTRGHESRVVLRYIVLSHVPLERMSPRSHIQRIEIAAHQRHFLLNKQAEGQHSWG